VFSEAARFGDAGLGAPAADRRIQREPGDDALLRQPDAALTVFGETLRLNVAAGAALIVAAGLFTLWRQRQAG